MWDYGALPYFPYSQTSGKIQWNLPKYTKSIHDEEEEKKGGGGNFL
jgi:hypothetical protein